MAADPVTAIATLLSEIFGFVVNPDGLASMTREAKLKWIMRGVNDALANDDRAAADALFGYYRELYAQSGP